MNNCILQGRIVYIDKVKFDYYNNLQAILKIFIAINCNKDNVIEVKIYDNNIDIF